MSRMVILRNTRTGRWDVHRTGEFARFVASFPTLLDAENFVTRGEGHEEAAS